LAWGCLLVVLLLGAGVFFSEPGKAVRDLWNAGVLQALAGGTERRAASEDREESLRSIWAALRAYQDSEGQYPAAENWMEALEPRLRTNDMTAEEAAKRLVRPDLRGTAGTYGYALNAAAAAKFRGDLPGDPVLVFESKAREKNATGDPAQDRDGLAITCDGEIVR
jgi:hypothetical protein